MEKIRSIVILTVFIGIYLVGSLGLYVLLEIGPTLFDWGMIIFLVVPYLIMAGIWYLGTRKFLKKSFILLGCLLLLIPTCINTTKCIDRSRHSLYTPERWKTHVEDRALMFDGLEKEYDFLKMTKSDIVNLLGKPVDDPERYMYFCPEQNDHKKIVYSFYYKNSMFPYEEVIIFEFDKNEKVINYYKGVVDH